MNHYFQFFQINIIKKTCMGSDLSNQQNIININDFYSPKQVLNSQIGKPTLLQLKHKKQTTDEFLQNAYKVQFIEKYSFSVLQKEFDYQQQIRFYNRRKASKTTNVSSYQINNQIGKKQTFLFQSKNNFVEVFQYDIHKEPYSKCMNNDYILEIYVQHVPIRLANIKKTLNSNNQTNILWNSLSFEEALYIYLFSLKGYSEISQFEYQHCWLPTQLTIGFNCVGQVKVWIQNDFSKNFWYNKDKVSNTQIVNEIIQHISQRCLNSEQFRNEAFINLDQYNKLHSNMSLIGFAEHLQNKLHREVQVGKTQIMNRFKVFQQDNHRWRYSREKVSMKSSVQYSPVLSKAPKYQYINQHKNQQDIRKRYYSESKIKQNTVFYKSNTEQSKYKQPFQARCRSNSENSKNPLTNMNINMSTNIYNNTKNMNNYNTYNNYTKYSSHLQDVTRLQNKLHTGKPSLITKNVYQSNKNAVSSSNQNSYSHICMSPVTKKIAPPSPSKNNVKFGYSNSGKKNYSQSITNIYSLTNQGSPGFFQNPSQFYLNKPVATLLSDPLISQPSKMNKPSQNNYFQDKIYYKNKSFRQSQMQRFIQQKLAHRQDGLKNQQSAHNRIKNIFQKKASSKLFLQQNNPKDELAKLEIKQFSLESIKFSQQTKQKKLLSTQREQSIFDLNIKGFEKVKQNNPLLQTSRQHIPIVHESQKYTDSQKQQSISDSQIVNSHLSIFQNANSSLLHHSVSSVKIPTSVQLQKQAQMQDFNEEAWLKKQQSLQKYRLVLEKAIHSTQQIQQIKPLKNPNNTSLAKEQSQNIIQNKMVMSGEDLANQFKMLLRSSQLGADEYEQCQQNMKPLVMKKRQTLQDFIDEFNIQITQMSEEDEESFVLEEHNTKSQTNSNPLK